MSETEEDNSSSSSVHSADDSDWIPSELIRVKIKSITGKEFTVMTHPEDNIMILKMRIGYQEGINYDDIQLLWGDRVLTDKTRLAASGVVEDTTFTMVPFMSAGRSVTLPEIDKRPSLAETFSSALFPVLETLQNLTYFADTSSPSTRLPHIFVGLVKPAPSAPTESNSKPAATNASARGAAAASTTSGRRTARSNRAKNNNNNSSSSKLPSISKGAGAARNHCDGCESGSGGDSSSGEPTERRFISSNALGLNRLKGEMVLYAKRSAAQGAGGAPPYSFHHLESYVRLKVRVLQEGKGSWAKRSLTPTVVANRKKEKMRVLKQAATAAAAAWKEQNQQQSGLSSSERKENIPSGRRGVSNSGRVFLVVSRPGSSRQQQQQQQHLQERRQQQQLSNNVNRCTECRRKLGLVTRYSCRCGGNFCPTHRLAETHNCTYDYKAEGRKEIALNNPRIFSNKLPEF